MHLINSIRINQLGSNKYIFWIKLQFIQIIIYRLTIRPANSKCFSFRWGGLCCEPLGCTRAWPLSWNVLKRPPSGEKSALHNSSNHSRLTPPQSTPKNRYNMIKTLIVIYSLFTVHAIKLHFKNHYKKLN